MSAVAPRPKSGDTPATDYHVADISQADYGRREIAIAERTAPVRAGWPRSVLRQTKKASTKTKMRAIPLAARWVNSIAVAPSNSGTT